MSEENKKTCLEVGDGLALRDLRYSNVIDDLGVVLEITIRDDTEFLKAIIRTDKGYEFRIMK